MLCLLADCRGTQGISTPAGKQRFAVCQELGASLIAPLESWIREECAGCPA